MQHEMGKRFKTLIILAAIIELKIKKIEGSHSIFQLPTENSLVPVLNRSIRGQSIN